MKNVILGFVSFFMLTSCIVTHDNFSSITRVNDIACSEKADRIYLFFEGEPIDYTYERIGLVEANGNKYTEDEVVLDYLKYEAWNACANAIINIRRDFKTKEEGTLLNDNDDVDLYDVTVFSGLAVRIHTDSAFVSKYGTGLDTSFRQNVAEDTNRRIKEANNLSTVYIVTMVLGIIMMVAILSGMGAAM
ncbi:hypothetical protein [Catalinimonas niigatensis]|uniref:hypothetical protein n=1 Tax=Catalinimonas niigatensis TaxID=1397264 RepID=UPI002665620E|nr:hypothetical protein [Catalinimonas niigatensis]WPP49372.1 hypothetical protein PZB72_22130 [Catalinimonas niigatensis]